jgi:hypothetical protein
VKTFEVTVTWMDSRQETYRCEGYLIRDDVLELSDSGSYAQRDDRRYIPLHSVRIFKAARTR